MTRIAAIILLMVLGPALLPGQGYNLEEIYNPEAILIDDSRIFINQGTDVFVYSKDKFNLLKKFGKSGEGPMEFVKSPRPWIPSLTIYDCGDNLLINSAYKVSFFTKDGEFIKEKKISNFGRVLPLGENLVHIKMSSENKTRLVVSELLDKDFNNIKRICAYKFPAQSGKKRDPILMARMSSYFDRYTYNGKFVFVSEDCTLSIFDQSGNKLTSFRPDYTAVPIDNGMEKKLDDFFLADIRFKTPYAADKSRGLLEFQDIMPLFKDYRISGAEIYVFSSFKKDGKYETFIYDLSGKFIKKTFLKIHDMDILTFYPFAISDHKIYQLVWNEEDEVSRLEISPIEF